MASGFTDFSTLGEHPACCLADKINEICAPLFNNFQINYFNYGRVYIEKTNIISCVLANSDKNFLHYYCNSDYKFLFSDKKINLWSAVMNQKAQKEAGGDFGFYNGILLKKTYPDYVEYLEFASSTKDISPLEFCVNKELINQFLIYFKEKAKSVLKTLEKDQLHFPSSRFTKLELKKPEQDYDEFCQAIKTKKLSIKFKSQEVVLTRREFDVLSFMIKGKSMREIGEVLQISPRTVESYLYNAKNKTNAFTVKQLLEYFTDSLF